jgi:hypothetical protein
VKNRQAQQVIRARIRVVDARIRSLNRSVALHGVDLRKDWDQLIAERIVLAKQLARLTNPWISPPRVMLLSLPLALIGGLLLWSSSGHARSAVGGFVVGLAAGAYLFIVRVWRRSQWLQSEIAYGLWP